MRKFLVECEIARKHAYSRARLVRDREPQFERPKSVRIVGDLGLRANVLPDPRTRRDGLEDLAGCRTQRRFRLVARPLSIVGRRCVSEEIRRNVDSLGGVRISVFKAVEELHG
jgi:hypothetical protein